MKKYHLFWWTPMIQSGHFRQPLESYEGSYDNPRAAMVTVEDLARRHKGLEAVIYEDNDGLSTYARYYTKSYAEWYDADGNVI